MTDKDVFNAAEIFLKALDAAPMGTGTILKDRASKDWMETSVLRAISKLDAASYHCANVARLVQDAHEKAETLAGRVEHPTQAKSQPTAMSVSGTFFVQEIAFEIDAFLAAARASTDFGGTVVALPLGMHGRTSITRVLESIEKAPKSLFAFLLAWTAWIEILKRFRDECVHYRALRTQTGYEAVHRKGALAVAILPFVIPQEIGPDQPDTRAARFGMGRDDDYLVEGHDKSESWGEVTMNDGSTRVLEHSISYSPAIGYVPVEAFCQQHLEKLREFLVHIFEETPKAKFKFQKSA
jgi:hypothetical protein